MIIQLQFIQVQKNKLQQKILRPKSLENNNQLICHRYINLNKKAFAKSLK